MNNISGLILFLLLFLVTFINSKIMRKFVVISKFETTALKGISILIIIISHFCRYSNQIGILSIFSKIGYLGAGVFFFLSGYGVAKSYQSKGFNNYLKDKITKVYLPFVFVNFLTIIIYGTIKHQVNNLYQNIKFILGFELYDHILWFVIVILFFYVVFYILFHNFKKTIAQVLLLMTSIAYLLICLIIGIQSQWYTSSICLFIGVFIAFNETKTIVFLNQHKLINIFTMLCFVVSTLINIVSNNNELIKNLSCYFSSILFMLLFVFILTQVEIRSKLAFLIGQISYMIYLIHMKIFNILFVQSSYLHIVPYLILVIVVSFFLNFLFGKNYLNHSTKKLE